MALTKFPSQQFVVYLLWLAQGPEDNSARFMTYQSSLGDSLASKLQDREQTEQLLELKLNAKGLWKPMTNMTKVAAKVLTWMI